MEASMGTQTMRSCKPDAYGVKVRPLFWIFDGEVDLICVGGACCARTFSLMIVCVIYYSTV